jgi:hypothetical protein
MPPQPLSWTLQFIRMSSTKFFLNPNSFVRMSSNAFVGSYPRYPHSPSAEPSSSFVRLAQNFFFWIPIHSYVFQFIRMSSNSFVCQPKANSFVCRPIHSYVFLQTFCEPQFICMSSTSFVCLPKKSFWTPIHSYVVQVFRMSSTSFVCLPQKSFWTPIHSHVVQAFRMSSNSFVCLPKTNPEP